MKSTKRAFSGFTMAELLVALAILGVIATFAIPKILNATSNGKLTAITKEAASMLGGAFSVYTLNNTLATTDTGAALTPYMNYTSVDTATTYTGSADTALQACAAATPCLLLHNGGVLQYDTAQTFNSTTSVTNGIWMNLDPDGTGTRGRISLIVFTNGRVTTGSGNGNAAPTHSGGTMTIQATDPSYLSNWN